MEKIILTDVDGVLLNWLDPFSDWCLERYGYERVALHGRVEKQIAIPEDVCPIELGREFNRTGWIGDLPPLGDAVKYVRKMYEEHGIRFLVISALGECRHAKRLRIQNLNEVFGAKVFTEVHCVKDSASKEVILERFEGTGMYWLEDSPANAEMGGALGLSPVLFGDRKRRAPVNVDSWRELYHDVMGLS